jgi:AcrR family transcriptional regulator
MASMPTDRTTEPGARRRGRPPRDEEELLEEALAIFAERGFDGPSMDDVAAAARTTKPTLYARFGSKDELFAAAVRREYALRKAALFEAYGAGGELPFRERLHGWTAAYFDFVRDRPAGFELISEGERHPASAAVIEQAGREIVDRIAELVLRVSRRDAPLGARVVAAMITGMLTACAREAARHPGVDLADAAALCESFLYSALRGVDPRLIEAVG